MIGKVGVPKGIEGFKDYSPKLRGIGAMRVSGTKEARLFREERKEGGRRGPEGCSFKSLFPATEFDRGSLG